MSKIVTHSGVVYFFGKVGNADGSIADQTVEMLRRAGALLEEAGTDKSKLLQAIFWGTWVRLSL